VIFVAQSDGEKPDIDEVFSPDMDPEGAIKEVLDATDSKGRESKEEPDIISDPGVEGGVDEPNESTEGPGTNS
jgi:hypothetical protein